VLPTRSRSGHEKTDDRIEAGARATTSGPKNRRCALRREPVNERPPFHSIHLNRRAAEKTQYSSRSPGVFEVDHQLEF